MLRSSKTHKLHPVPTSNSSYSCIHLWSLFYAKAHLRPGQASSREKKTYNDKEQVKFNCPSFFPSFLKNCSFLQKGQMENQNEPWRGFKWWKNHLHKGEEKSQFSLNLHPTSNRNTIHKELVNRPEARWLAKNIPKTHHKNHPCEKHTSEHTFL